MNKLTGEIFDRAFRALNGEYAWRREDVPTALASLADASYAILGGEVWLVIDDKIHGMDPSAVDELPGVWPWDTEPRTDSESWSEFCHRTAKESIRAVDEMPVESQCRADVRSHLYFNVTSVGPNESL